MCSAWQDSQGLRHCCEPFEEGEKTALKGPKCVAKDKLLKISLSAPRFISDQPVLNSSSLSSSCTENLEIFQPIDLKKCHGPLVVFTDSGEESHRKLQVCERGEWVSSKLVSAYDFGPTLRSSWI